MRISDWSSDVCSSDLCSLPVAFNGAVTSYSGSRFSTFGNEPGGNIWFYNAGGLLIGDGATFNVGSLLLTTHAIDNTGGLFGPGGAIRFRCAASTPTTAPDRKRQRQNSSPSCATRMPFSA